MNTKGKAALSALLWVLLSLACGCSDDEPAKNAGGTGGNAGQGGTGPGTGGAAGVPDAGTCDPDPLRTGLVAEQTGVSVDAFDCTILEAVAKYGEPDSMLIKAIIYAESRFDMLSAGCPNLPCGQPDGWTAAECGCLGLMQVVVACGGPLMAPALLPNGRPNMTTDPSSSNWLSSVFHPDINIDLGVGALAGNRAQVVEEFPGCTVDQYTLMALGNYANYGSTKGCTTYNTDYLDHVLPAYQQYAEAAGYAAHAY